MRIVRMWLDIALIIALLIGAGIIALATQVEDEPPLEKEIRLCERGRLRG